MDDAALNLSIRTFLKQFGVSAQREMEHAVARGLETGVLRGHERVPVRATLTVDGLVVDFHVDGELTLG
jgi:hypothetical protein